MAETSYFEEVTGFKFWDASSWSVQQAVVFVTGVAFAFEFLGKVVPLAFGVSKRIEARGRHHDELDWKDLVRKEPLSVSLRLASPRIRWTHLAPLHRVAIRLLVLYESAGDVAKRRERVVPFSK